MPIKKGFKGYVKGFKTAAKEKSIKIGADLRQGLKTGARTAFEDIEKGSPFQVPKGKQRIVTPSGKIIIK